MVILPNQLTPESHESSRSTPNETNNWHDLYRSDRLLRHRQQTHSKKLQRLGVLNFSRQAALLDVCCGTGEMLDILAQNGFQNLTGVDLGEVPQEGQRSWRFVQGSATKLPFEAESMELILCAHSLHHIGGLNEIKTFFQEAYRCLKPGGRLAVIDHYDSLQLRIAQALIESPLGLLTPYTRDFRRQLLEEKTYLYAYLDRWKQLESFLNSDMFENVVWDRDSFFFYWNGFKPN